MIAIIDYGVGNLFSLKSSLEAIGQKAVVTGEQEVLDRASHIILPGVGAFGDAVQRLHDTGMFRAALYQAEQGKPLFGICLGMQMLLETSYEYGVHRGLGLIQGEVRPISEQIPEGLLVPHMGWNALSFGKEKSPLFAEVEEGEYLEIINPEIIKTRGKVTDSEGCLSIPDFYCDVTRPKYVKIKAQDRNGDEFFFEAKDYIARCICHEIDHLNGVLFVDYTEEGQIYRDRFERLN